MKKNLNTVMLEVYQCTVENFVMLHLRNFTIYTITTYILYGKESPTSALLKTEQETLGLYTVDALLLNSSPINKIKS